MAAYLLAPVQVRLLEYLAVFSTRIKIAAGLVVYLIAAAVVFVPVVRLQKLVPGRMSALVAPSPPAGFTKKPAAANVVAAATSPFAEVKTAARKSKDSTGSYSVEWAKQGSNDAVSMVISLLPTAVDAAKVQQEARSTYASKGSLKSQAYTYGGPVVVPGVPAASAGVFKSATTGNPPLVVIAFQEGRAQVTVFTGIKGTPAPVERVAASFARSEYDHLRARLAGFSLVRTSWPALSTAIYWIVVALIAGTALSVPFVRRRAERRRIAAAERARMQHKTVRGSKIVKRQAGRKSSR